MKQQQMQPLIRVVIADDHPVILKGIRAILGASPTIHISNDVNTFEQVMDVVRQSLIDVAVMDIHGMGSTPLTIVSRLRRDYPGIGLVIFSSSIDLAPEMLRLGVHAYVAKEDMESELVQAIEAAASFQQFLSQSVTEYLHRINTINDHTTSLLSEREQEVLKYLSQGYSTERIAEMLILAPRSVQNHITRIRGKLGCVSRVQLVEYYRRMYQAV